MVRFRTLNFALALLVIVPTAAVAQKDSQFTKEANKFIGLAMANPDRAARTNLYTQALVHLRQGMERDAANAKVWKLSGDVLAALGQMTEADEAWKKAVQMHPAYAAEVADEREAAWVEAFNVGMQAMDAQKYAEAIKILEDAELIFQGRPEALMNLGALYANANDNAKAEDAFRRAIDATKGPFAEKLSDEQKQEWARFRDMATMNIAQIHGALGVEAFQVASEPTLPAEQAIKKFEEAAQHFAKAAEINPYSRDYVFNHTQALWAQVSKLDDALEAATPATAGEIKAKLMPLYDQVEALARKTREFDPNNGGLYLIEAKTHRDRGEITGTDASKAAGQQKALELLTARDVLTVVVDEIAIQSAPDGATIQGKLLPNVKTTGEIATAAGTPVTIKFTLLGASGQTLGEATVTANAPAAPAEGADPTSSFTPFELKTDIKGEIAGWKYVVGR